MNGAVGNVPQWQAVAGDEATFSESALATFKSPDQARGSTRAACLVLVYPAGPQTGTRYTLAGDAVVIGRDPECAIRNQDPSVSRRHAVLKRGDDGRYRVLDAGSTNGTFVNETTNQGEVLRDGDYLRVGNCLYRFLTGDSIECDYREEVYRLTIVDALTKVHNRRYLNEFLEREVSRAVRRNRPLAFALIDIDRFKALNEEMGNLAGDFALKEICARVATDIGSDELLARYGGDEFALVLPESSAEEAVAIAERIRQTVASRPFLFDGRSYTLAVSVGIAVTPGGVQLTVADLLRAADANLYQAKLNGRNRVFLG